jgi:hypothetical protein
MTLTYTVPDQDVAAFAEGVINTLEKLGVDYTADEISPADENGEVTYTVLGVAVPAVSD